VDAAASSLAARLDAYVTAMAARHRFSGAVFVAQRGTVLLSKGYGMADQEGRVPNSPTTRYPVAGISFAMSLVAALKLEEQGRLHDGARICAYLPSCPVAWQALTIGAVVGGTAGLPGWGWEQQGHTVADSLAGCQSEALTTQRRRTTVDYQNCTVIVLGTIFEKVTGQPWATVMRDLIFRPAGMPNSGRMTDALVPPARARDYAGAVADRSTRYNTYFQVVSTLRDIAAYNTALFSGKILTPSSLAQLFAPRAPVSPPDATITAERQAAQWKIGKAFGHPVIFTTGTTYSFTAANLRFPHDGLTIVVLSNQEQNDVEDLAVHVAALVFGAPRKAPPLLIIAPSRAIVARIVDDQAIGGTFGTAAWADGTLWATADGQIIRIDTRTNRIIAHIKVGDSARVTNHADPWSVVAAHGQVWATDRADQAVVQIDPATNRIVRTLPVGIEAFNLAIVGQTLWTEGGRDGPADQHDTVVRLDLRTGKVVAVLHVGGVLWMGLLATPDAIWLTSWNPARVLRLDPATNKIVASITVGTAPESLAAGAGAVWVADQATMELDRIDTRTNTVTARSTLPAYPGYSGEVACAEVVVGGGAVWKLDSQSTLVRIDPQTGRPTASLDLGRHADCMAWGAGSVWVGSGAFDDMQSSGEIDRIDPRAMLAP
jgi:CubicO group peptidase (beta-lactamase class C family)